MMTAKQENLGELELAVLKLVWEYPGSTVQEIAQKINEQRACARTTVLTVMQRLHKKGFLTRRKQAGVFRFTASEKQDTVLNGLVERFVNVMLDGSALPFLSYLAQTRKLTEKQKEELQRLVESIEKDEDDQ